MSGVARPGLRWLPMLLVVAGCRDATEALEIPPRLEGDGSPPVRLTFSPEDDRSPSWNVAGDSVLFVAQGEEPFQETPGLLLRVSDGGSALEGVVPEVQFPGLPRRQFATPVVSPAGDRVAWMELFTLRGGRGCPKPACGCAPR